MPLSMTWRQLATPGSSIEILARFLQIYPTHRSAEAPTGVSQSIEPTHATGDRTKAHPGTANRFDRVSVPTHSLVRHGCRESSRVQERKPMRTVPAFWRRSQVSAPASTKVFHRPDAI